MPKHAVLILAHNDVSHVFKFAELNPSANFYIHIDSKAGPIRYKNYPKNVYFLPDYLRHSVVWAGFSMVEASNSLFTYALQNQENSFFHLISGSDVILQNIDNFQIDENIIYMDCLESYNHRYRIRFNTIHANKSYQRKLTGKALTLCYRILDKVMPTKIKPYYGSQWFSIHRNYLEIIIDSITPEVNEFFRKKLCPDEHYYQYLVFESNLSSYLSNDGNKRFIIFDKKFNNGNNPIFLDIDQLMNIDKNKYWFARKAKAATIDSYLKAVGQQ